MSSNSWTYEIKSDVSASRLFKAAITDWHNLGPKIAPQIILSASLVFGDGGKGTVGQFNFTSEMPFNYVKEKLDYVDNNTYECKTSLIEGGGIGIKIESASSEIMFEPKTDSSCVCKVVASCKPMRGTELKEEESEMAKASFQGVLKVAEAYLMANTDAYN